MCGKKLKLNAIKTQVLTLGTGKRLQNTNASVMVHMDGVTLNASNSNVEKLSGCHLESNLKWHKHFEELVKTLKKRIADLECIRKFVSYDTRKLIAQRMFTSVLSYCLPLYSGGNRNSLESLQVLQNKVARIVTMSPMGTSRKNMFDSL